MAIQGRRQVKQKAQWAKQGRTQVKQKSRWSKQDSLSANRSLNTRDMSIHYYLWAVQTPEHKTQMYPRNKCCLAYYTVYVTMNKCYMEKNLLNGPFL